MKLINILTSLLMTSSTLASVLKIRTNDNQLQPSSRQEKLSEELSYANTIATQNNIKNNAVRTTQDEELDSILTEGGNDSI